MRSELRVFATQWRYRNRPESDQTDTQCTPRNSEFLHDVSSINLLIFGKVRQLGPPVQIPCLLASSEMVSKMFERPTCGGVGKP
jgi:hypothetical protein